MTADARQELGRGRVLAQPALPAAVAWQRASRQELVLLALYFFLVVAATDVFNIRLGVELMTLAVALSALLITRAFRVFLHDWWFFLAGLILWNLGGPIAAHSPLAAHLDFMLQADRWLFFGHDPVVLVQQHLASGAHVNSLDWLTAAAYNLHVPEPYIAGYFLWRISRTVFLQFAAAALILLGMGFLTFILFPAVPPWMASTWFDRIPDVTNRFGNVLRSNPFPFHGTPLFYVFRLTGDAVAAFPSEHAAFPLLELLAFWRAAGKRLVLPFALWVLWVLFTVVYLGEHWVTDALAGYVYALVIFGAVIWFTEGRAGLTGRTSPAQAR